MYSLFVGIDISKSTFNYAFMLQGKVVHEEVVENSKLGVEKMISVLRNRGDADLGNTIFCLEHTGIYSNHVLQTLHSFAAAVCAESGSSIKNSLGLQRGKSDQVDARRIAQYAYRFTDRLKLWKPKESIIEQLQHLTAVRDRLVKIKVQLEVPLNEAKDFIRNDYFVQVEKSSTKIISSIDQEIKEIEGKIKSLINSDKHLRPLLVLITSVPGIGEVTATEFIIRTNAFNNFDNAKKLACHVGIAPFEHSSGSSIRGRSRVSHKAHKRMKKLLYLAAMAAIRTPGEIQEYYTKKVREGKPKMSVLNAVKNKLVHRVFAVVQNQVMYDKNYYLSLAIS
jgi:transposase